MNEKNMEDLTLLSFYSHKSRDMLAKCRKFHTFLDVLEKNGTYHSSYRVTLSGGIDNRIQVFDPREGRNIEMICYDSNSYLGLHHHPRVIQAVKRTLDHTGFGTPSSQILCGTNHYLLELEETVASFHNREDAMIFPSGFAANLGVLNALLRKTDIVVADRFSHASIHDGIHSSKAGEKLIYPHRDIDKLDQLLSDKTGSSFKGGKLIVTDGVFSMHGTLAPLTQLRKVATKHDAYLLVDEAHSIGVIGPNGLGIEEHFGMPGSIDIISGTFSKAPGALGGYICGSKELIKYARFFANSGLFTASLPAATCAGLTESLRIMKEEPQHRKSLWENVHALTHGLKNAGLPLAQEPESPILTVFLGASRLLRQFSRDLYDARIKCGIIDYPAVQKGHSVVRIAVNARHTKQDLEQTVDIFYRLGKKHGILNKNKKEIKEIGSSEKLYH